MKQALHIFRKDVRYLRYDIGMTLLAALAFCLTGVYNLRGPTVAMLPVTWWFLIGRVIHAEALPGNRQFWLTRPYRWKSLLGAKVLFIAAFIHLPLLLADAAIIHAAGFSMGEKAAGLIWTQVLLLAAFVLPAAAISAITNGIAELLTVTLLLVVLALVWLLASPLLPWNFPWMELEWVKVYYVVAQVAVAAAIILIRQYARRNTFVMRMLTGVIAVMLLVTSTLLPWGKAFALQTRLSRRKADLSSIRIELDSERKWLGRIYPTGQEQIAAELPFRVSGLPTGTEFKPNGLTVRLRAFDGETFVVNQPPPESFNFEADIASLRAIMGKTFYTKVKEQPLQLRGTLYFTLYGSKRQAVIPANNRPVPVEGVGLCTAGTIFVLCHSAFRPPSDSVTIRILQDSLNGAKTSTEDFSRTASYSPFPADLNINPLFTIFSPRVNAISAARVETWEPLAHVKRNFEFNQVRLSDFMASSPLAAVK
jgi:hypothetical protein